MPLVRRIAIFAALASSAPLLGACAGHAGAGGPFVPAQQTLQSLVDQPDAVPPDCTGQKSFSKYATDATKLSTKGGTVCIPAFGGFGGNVAYPSASPSVTLTLTSSTTNYTKKLPKLHSGTPIFYLQVAIGGATTFGAKAKAGGGLTGAKITVGDTYTVFGQATIDGFPVNLTPCYVKATKGKYGGVIGGVGTLLEGQNVPASANGVIEIYAGKFAGGTC